MKMPRQTKTKRIAARMPQRRQFTNPRRAHRADEVYGAGNVGGQDRKSLISKENAFIYWGGPLDEREGLLPGETSPTTAEYFDYDFESLVDSYIGSLNASWAYDHYKEILPQVEGWAQEYTAQTRSLVARGLLARRRTFPRRGQLITVKRSDLIPLRRKATRADDRYAVGQQFVGPASNDYTITEVGDDYVMAQVEFGDREIESEVILYYSSGDWMVEPLEIGERITDDHYQVDGKVVGVKTLGANLGYSGVYYTYVGEFKFPKSLLNQMNHWPTKS